MSESKVETSREEIIESTAQYIQKLIKDGVLKFSFVPPAENLVPMISNCLVAHDKGTFDPVVIAVFDTIETYLKLSIRWTPERVIVGSGIVVHDNTLENRQRAKMWATMLHLNNFKDILKGV